MSNEIKKAKLTIVNNCDRKCKKCKDMKNGFCSIIFEIGGEPSGSLLDGLSEGWKEEIKSWRSK